MSLSLQFQSLLNTVTIMMIVMGLGVVAQQSVHTLELTNGPVSPDGVTRQAVLVNGGLFSKVITGQKGDEFVIEVDNQLTLPELRKSTSIHWHGLFQRGSQWADGPAFVTQCPISPGHKFTYRFTATEEAGTYWYHSHLDAQYCDGLRGAFVIYDPNDPHLDLYDVDDESTVITLADCNPDATLINGLGRTSATPTAPLAVVNVQKDVKYRFRLVSISCDPNWVFSIEGHELTVIEADGVSMQPVIVTSLQILAGQRYSFVLHANQPVDNYWIRANPNLPPTGFNSNINSAILRYQGAPEQEPTSSGIQDTSKPLLETNLHPVVNPGAPGLDNIDGADVPIVLPIGLASGRFNINGTSLQLPDVPTLLQILSGANAVEDLLPSEHYIQLPPNKVIQISFPVIAGQGSAIGGPHPIHLHGHTFDVIRSAGNSTYNYVDPPRRDVVSMGGPGDNVTIRFVTDNAGPWFLHCHIEWHLQAGLGVVLAENIPGVASSPQPPQEWEELCNAYNSLAPEDQ
uniref:Laccase 8 n=1 Tax=Volvariella volvacea TaxID=36659 RepID=U5QBE0_9AGAR|nr:laccase 8 [Volvariella volvacea]